MAKKQYYFLIPVDVKTVEAEAKAKGEVLYAVIGGTTTDDLNWLNTFKATDKAKRTSNTADGLWTQNVVQDEEGGRAAVMRISRKKG